MKRKKILIGCTAVLVSVSAQVLSQQTDVVRLGVTGELLRPKTLLSKKVKEVYADSSWAPTTIILEKSEKPENVLARYELRSNQLEVKMLRGIGVLDASLIKLYTTVDGSGKTHEFVNGKDFNINGVPVKGMIEVLSLGKMALYKKYGYYIKIPDYNISLSVGNPNEQLFLEQDLYYAVDRTLIKVPRKKEKLLGIFGDKTDQLSLFARQNKVRVSTEAGLKALFDFYNSL